ncbi:MAG TPA: SCO family protein [Terriglobales bacterium]|nr:SCO family protein [Terriglobales bacterium]
MRSQHTLLITAFLLGTLLTGSVTVQQRYFASGLVVKVDPQRKVAVVSCDRIPGYMEAMTMPIAVREAKDLEVLKPGRMVDFTLVVDKDSAIAESVRLHLYQGLEPDPAAARRLKLLARATAGSEKTVAIGDPVPDFTLTAEDNTAVTLSRLRGKIVALNFVYTRCALPNFCVRSSNNFVKVQERFHNRIGTDLLLLTVTFDPVHDTPDVLKKYANQYHADPNGWHFLTGSESAIRRVCNLFGEDYFPDEGLMDHSLHTAILNRKGRLIANLEGNEFSAKQLGDLVETVLKGN